MRKDCNGINSGNGSTCGHIIVDLNGEKSPNSSGEDIFQFFIDKNAIVPYGLPNSGLKFERACDRGIAVPYPNYSSTTNMYGCTGWVLQNENMDYLKCDDLSWNGKHKCSDK